MSRKTLHICDIILFMKRKFAERLKDLRTETGLSFAKLGKEVGLSDASLCRWENGEMDITSDNLIVLAKYFGVSTDYLLGLED